MTEEERLHQLAQDYFEANYRAMPMLATNLGIHTYDHLLGDLSARGFKDFLNTVKDFAARFEAIAPEKLSPEKVTDHLLLSSDARAKVRWLEKFPEWRLNPNLYPEVSLFAVFLLITREFAPLEERLVNVAARLRQVPEALEAGKANVENPPRVFTEVAIQTTEGGIQFCQQFIPLVAAQVPKLQDEVMAANEKALQAYQDYLAFLREELLPRSHGDFAIGQELFEEKLRDEHMLDLSVAQLESLGRRVFEETEEQLKEIAARIDRHKDWPTLVEEAREHHPPGEGLLDAYREELGKLKRFIIEHELVSIPEGEELVVMETPLFERAVIPYAAYMSPAPFEKEQKGQFWVTPLNTAAPPEAQKAQLREHCLYSLPILALHEAYPGHHLQLTFSNQKSSWLRKHFQSTSFIEGWAFYCEQLMGEVGYYTDPRMRLFQLKDQLWRAARVIIDVGLHTRKMDIAEAVRLLVDRVHLSEAAALSEVRRYTMSPTQPMSYLAGKVQILQLREKFAHVPLRRFHDALLSIGSIPIKLVARELEARL